MEDEHVQNRMVEKPDLDPLRKSSEKPSWLSRTWGRVVLRVRGKTGMTILLALAIGVAIALLFWVGR
jgi:hypothetical protein